MFNVTSYSEDAKRIQEGITRMMYREENQTKSLSISYKPLRCELVVTNKIIEKVMQIEYIGT